MLPLFVAMAAYNDSADLTSPVSFTPEVIQKTEVNNDTSNTEHTRGQLLYENHCRVCHDQSVHKRAGHRAHSKGEINYWTTRWSKELELNWSTQDIDDVVDYLQNTFYQHTQEDQKNQ